MVQGTGCWGSDVNAGTMDSAVSIWSLVDERNAGRDKEEESGAKGEGEI